MIDELVIQAYVRRRIEVLDNLLENALTYSPEDGVVEVVVRPLVASHQAVREHPLSGSDHAGGPGRTGLPSRQGKPEMIEICVRDSGKGIPAEHLESIFERF